MPTTANKLDGNYTHVNWGGLYTFIKTGGRYVITIIQCGHIIGYPPQSQIGWRDGISFDEDDFTAYFYEV